MPDMQPGGDCIIDIVCVCVSTPVPKGSTLFLVLNASSAADGDTCIASPSTKLAIHGEDISSGRGTDVPAFNTPTPMVHPAAVRWFHGPSSRYSPTNRFATAVLSRS